MMHLERDPRVFEARVFVLLFRINCGQIKSGLFPSHLSLLGYSYLLAPSFWYNVGGGSEAF